MAVTARIWPGAIAAYGGAFVVGATLVSFPASSVFLRASHGFSDAQYGAIYLPQLVAALAGAVLGGVASRAWSLRGLYMASLALFLSAQGLLATSAFLDADLAFIVIMVATASFGFGFGFGGGPLNGIVAALFPRTPNSAITALHMCAGAGLTVAPLAFAQLAAINQWVLGPVLLGVITVAMLALTLATRLPQPAPLAQSTANTLSPARDPVFWIVAIAAVAYALVEGTFSNWAILYLQDDVGLKVGIAAGALTAFWGMLTLGRLAATLLALRLRPLVFLCILPPLMVFALAGVRAIETPGAALLGFGFAGLACSAFFPMLVGFCAESHPRSVSWIAAMLTAALMIGVGLGSYAIGYLRGILAIRDLYAYACIYPVAALAAVLFAARCLRHRAPGIITRSVPVTRRHSNSQIH